MNNTQTSQDNQADFQILDADKVAIDELLQQAEVHAAEGDSVRFNETEEDYTIVFGRSKSPL